MDKRFLYLMLVIAGALVIMLAWQDSKKQGPSVLDKLNASPTPAIGISPQFLSPTPSPAQQTRQIEPMIDKNASPAAVQTLEGGLQLLDFVLGAGKEVKSGDTITVNYIGYLESGQKFDSSYDRNQPFTVQIGAGKVIQGWDVGLIGMKEGGKRRLIVPSAMAYGEQGAGNGVIPPNANLIFDVELLSVQ